MLQRWALLGLVVFSGALLWIMLAWPVTHAPPSTFEAGEAGARALTAEPVVANSPVPLRAAKPPTAELPAEPLAADDEPVEPVFAPESAEPPAAEMSAEAQADRLFIRENGPLAEYKQRFESEPRDSAASEAEQVVRAAFSPKDTPHTVIRSVLCRETICKIETRISEDNLGAYVAAMTRIVGQHFDSRLATERTTLVQAGEVSVTVYAKRPADPK